MPNNFFSYSPVEATRDRNKGILRHLSDEDWDKVLSFGALRRYPSGSVIIRPGPDDRALYFVISGVITVRAGTGGETPAVRYGEGNVLGILSFLDGEPSSHTAVADGDVEIMVLTPETFEQMAAWHPRIGIMLLRDLGSDVAHRLRRHEASL